jgi:flagellar protein FliO/FliZ
MIRAALLVLIALLLAPLMAHSQQPAVPAPQEQPAPVSATTVSPPPALPPQPVSQDSQNKIQDVNALLALPEEGPASPAIPTADSARARSTFDLLLQSLMALCIVLALILCASWLVRRFGKRSPLLAGAELATILGRVHLSPKATLHFVRVDDKVLVIGVTQNNMSLITELEAIPAPEPGIEDDLESAAPPSTGSGAFARQLRRDLERTSGKPMAYDAEIATLRDDLHRLQESLKGSSGDPQ